MDAILSFATGTLGLLAALIVSAVLVATRPSPETWQVGTRAILIIALLCHGAHLLEETIFGFYLTFPELLGLSAWPMSLFLFFNLSLIAIWTTGLLWQVPSRLFTTMYFFLGIASALNGVAHPLFSYLNSGYFPGLVTSPAIAIVGILLLKRLWNATEEKP